MALFNNDPEKNSQPLKPQVIAGQPAAAIQSPDRGIEPHQMAAYLDRGTKVTGKLHFEGPARIDGEVEGEIRGKSITIGEHATVTAQITADSVVVCGKVKGEICASQRIEIRATARVQGNVTAPKLMIHEGAIFDGHCAMESPGARDDRKGALHTIERNGTHGDSAATA
jgi:cytoskeletal protein CcmA (bactofilin family)